MRFGRSGVVWIVAVGLGVSALRAQSTAVKWSTDACHGEGEEGAHSWGWGSSEHLCELRQTVLPASARVDVRGTNGGIEVVGEDRSNIALEARVMASGSSKSDAEEIERKVTILTEGVGGAELKVRDDGPKLSGWFSHSSYSVSYRLRVPRRLSVDLHTVNGGVALKRVSGTLQVETVNGGLSLEDLGGDLQAETVNGGITLGLTGERWQGGGVKAHSVNGGVSVTAPSSYSAHLVASTVNGDISVGFPVTVQGRIRHSVDTTLGQGGPTIDLQTVNGAVSVGR